MAVNFDKYLSVPVESAEAPVAPPIGHWQADITKWAAREVNYQPDVKTPVVTLSFKLTAPYDDAQASAEEANLDTAKFINKIVTRDYTMNEEGGTYGLRQVGEVACDLDVKGLSFSDMLPQLVGQTVKLYVDQRAGKGDKADTWYPNVTKVLMAD